MDFEAALVVDEVNHLLESLGVGVIKEEPLDPWFAQLGAEVWAGDRKEESVAPKLLPGELCLEYFYGTSRSRMVDNIHHFTILYGTVILHRICRQTLPLLWKTNRITFELSRIHLRSAQGSRGQGGRSHDRRAPSDS